MSSLYDLKHNSIKISLLAWKYRAFLTFTVTMTLKAKVIAINKLLTDIYQREMRLSILLSKLNFNIEDINLISNKLLSETVAYFLETLEETIITSQDGDRQLKIIQGSYGLNSSPQTLRQLAEEFNISHERIRQLKQKILTKLKSTNNKSKLELLFKHKIKQAIANYRNIQFFTKTDDIYQKKYKFSLSLLSNGQKSLTIAEGDNQITITESDFLEFYNKITTIKLEWGIKTYSLEEVRKKHQKAYAKWTREEEELLIDNLAEGLNVKEIAEILGRQPGAISSRINKLGLNNN